MLDPKVDSKKRMAQDMNHELKDTGVHALSIWPGAVKTELIRENILDKEATNEKEKEAQQMFSTGQTTDWVGRTVAQLLLIDVKPLAGRVIWCYDVSFDALSRFITIKPRLQTSTIYAKMMGL